jgi:hypothetical protein
MSSTQKWFALVLLTGPLHMSEQLVTGIEEFHMIRRTVIEPYFSMFAHANADWASVLLITIVGAIFSALFYLLAAGGVPRLVALVIFGLMGAGEIHHAVEALASASYDPGVITSFLYAWSGWQLLVAVKGEWPGLRRRTVAAGLVNA